MVYNDDDDEIVWHYFSEDSFLGLETPGNNEESAETIPSAENAPVQTLNEATAEEPSVEQAKISPQVFNQISEYLFQLEDEQKLPANLDELIALLAQKFSIKKEDIPGLIEQLETKLDTILQHHATQGEVENKDSEEEARVKAEKEAEEQRLAEEARVKAVKEAEEQRLAEEARAKAVKEAEEQRLAEEARVKAEKEAEEQRLAEEARVKAEKEAEEQRLAEEARVKAEKEAEEQRLAEEARVKAEKEAEESLEQLVDEALAFMKTQAKNLKVAGSNKIDRILLKAALQAEYNLSDEETEILVEKVNAKLKSAKKTKPVADQEQPPEETPAPEPVPEPETQTLTTEELERKYLQPAAEKIKQLLVAYSPEINKEYSRGMGELDLLEYLQKEFSLSEKSAEEIFNWLVSNGLLKEKEYKYYYAKVRLTEEDVENEKQLAADKINLEEASRKSAEAASRKSVEYALPDPSDQMLRKKIESVADFYRGLELPLKYKDRYGLKHYEWAEVVGWSDVNGEKNLVVRYWSNLSGSYKKVEIPADEIQRAFNFAEIPDSRGKRNREDVFTAKDILPGDEVMVDFRYPDGREINGKFKVKFVDKLDGMFLEIIQIPASADEKLHEMRLYVIPIEAVYGLRPIREKVVEESEEEKLVKEINEKIQLIKNVYEILQEADRTGSFAEEAIVDLASKVNTHFTNFLKKAALEANNAFDAVDLLVPAQYDLLNLAQRVLEQSANTLPISEGDKAMLAQELFGSLSRDFRDYSRKFTHKLAFEIMPKLDEVREEYIKLRILNSKKDETDQEIARKIQEKFKLTEQQYKILINQRAFYEYKSTETGLYSDLENPTADSPKLEIAVSVDRKKEILQTCLFEEVLELENQQVSNQINLARGVGENVNALVSGAIKIYSNLPFWAKASIGAGIFGGGVAASYFTSAAFAGILIPIGLGQKIIGGAGIGTVAEAWRKKVQEKEQRKDVDKLADQLEILLLDRNQHFAGEIFSLEAKRQRATSARREFGLIAGAAYGLGILGGTINMTGAGLKLLPSGVAELGKLGWHLGGNVVQWIANNPKTTALMAGGLFGYKMLKWTNKKIGARNKNARENDLATILQENNPDNDLAGEDNE